jgi:hypothetical protein
MKAIFLSFLLLTSAAFGSGEAGVAIDRITISSSKHNVGVTVTKEPKSGVAISITFEGKKFSIPRDVMVLFPDVQLRSVRILTHVPTGHLPDGWLKDHPYIISFDYGDEKIHGRDGKEVEVYARARLFCNKASYSGWEKFIPEGDFKNRWNLYQPMFLEGDGFNGTADGIVCPLDN